MSGRARAFWVLFAAMITVYLVMVLWTLPEIAASADGLKAFDVRPAGYSETQARAFLTALSADGRVLYLGVQHRLDTAYPALVALTLIYALFWAFPRSGNAARVAFFVVPTAAAVFDYLENARVGAMLAMAPQDVTADMISAASSATVIKSGLSTVAFVMLLLGLARKLFLKWKSRNG